MSPFTYEFRQWFLAKIGRQPVIDRPEDMALADLWERLERIKEVCVFDGEDPTS